MPLQMPAMNAGNELEPFVLYRFTDGQVECALWQLKDGPRALALFQTSDRAVNYRHSAALGDEWKVFRPARMALLELLRAVYRNGVQLAVVDPDASSAQRIFDIKDILDVTGGT